MSGCKEGVHPVDCNKTTFTNHSHRQTFKRNLFVHGEHLQATQGHFLIRLTTLPSPLAIKDSVTVIVIANRVTTLYHGRFPLISPHCSPLVHF